MRLKPYGHAARWLLAALALIAQTASAGQALAQEAACTPPAGANQTITLGAIHVWWQTEPAPLAVSQPFVLLLKLCPAKTRLLRVDATMPEHRHGMNYKPSLVDLGGGRWRAEGLLWHMPGRWELRLDVQHADKTEVLLQSVVLR